MRINFEHIQIHNFLSIGDIELALDDRGLVLVEGVNGNSSDSAISNGSGKSSIFNAICWALTGETIQGVTNDVVNIYSDGGCFVKLTATINDDKYEITRMRDYNKQGSDLKVIVNGEDKSGKGIRESTKVLAEMLPDLTSDLIGSIIILGQGLPHRFSNNTPAGRKEILERLSKSDFMIEDIKARLGSRKDTLNDSLRVEQDGKVGEQAKLELYETSIEENKTTLQELMNNVNNVDNREELTKRLDEVLKEIQDLETSMKDTDDIIEKLTSELTTLTTSKAEEIARIEEQFKAKLDKLTEEKIHFSALVKSAQAEYDRVKNIKDICPTCGQKITSVHKPDLAPYEAELETAKTELAGVDILISDTNDDKKVLLKGVEKKYDIGAIKEELEFNNEEWNRMSDKLKELNGERLGIQVSLSDHKNDLLAIEKLKDTISAFEQKRKDSQEKIVYYIEREEELLARIDVINQMFTIVKRDFRGYLLSNVIEYIARKSNDYAEIVFGNRFIDFALDGNNINIAYHGKPYENLSGGEKQKVDLILQFALKDMLNTYLNIHCNILVLDEIFDNLDVVGCQKVLNLISALKDVNSLYVISHHADELQIPYDSEIKIQKNELGISSMII